MSWFQRLYETYDTIRQSPYPVEENRPLLPLSHTSQQAHITVTIDSQGNFRRAELLGKKALVIPVTENSAGRTSGKVAHPLIDKIKYCAKDYADFGGENLFQLYSDELGAWVKSPYTHPMAEAVYSYVQKGTLVADLVNAGICILDDSGKLKTTLKEGETAPELFRLLTSAKSKTDKTVRLFDQGDLLVAWQVEMPGENESRTWENASLREKWGIYDTTKPTSQGKCMITGKTMRLAQQHPRNIRRPGDGAKLVSANDTSGFTFRGRFTDAGQACTIGYETSQKAHHALRWLINRQGFRTGDQVVVAWTPKGIDVPQPLGNDWLLDGDGMDFGLVDNPETTVQQTVPDHTKDLGQTFARKLRNAMTGYSARLGSNDTVAVLGLDAATPGRLAVTFYREQFWHEYQATLEQWQKDMAWMIRQTREVPDGGKKKTEVFWQYKAPTPLEIANAAYGRRLDDSLKKNTVERLLACITDNRQIPFDLVQSCINRAARRAGLENWDWQNTLGIACALFKGYSIRNPDKDRRKEYTMGLDETNKSRDYLFGRLLAIAERIEEIALNARGEKRPTNAERLMQRFADAPYQTWRQLEMSLQPYRQGLKQSRGGFIHNMDTLLDNVLQSFSLDEFIENKRLSGEFLLGYHCQRFTFRNQKESESTTSSEGENK